MHQLSVYKGDNKFKQTSFSEVITISKFALPCILQTEFPFSPLITSEGGEIVLGIHHPSVLNGVVKSRD
jgi:hypothetical protein